MKQREEKRRNREYHTVDLNGKVNKEIGEKSPFIF